MPLPYPSERPALNPSDHPNERATLGATSLVAIIIRFDLVPCFTNQASDLGLVSIGRLSRCMRYDILGRSIPKFYRNVKIFGSKKVFMDAYSFHIDYIRYQAVR